MVNLNSINAFAKKIQASPEQKTRMLSKRFWESINVQRRTETIIQDVYAQLTRLGIQIILEKDVFGREEDDQWIFFHYWDIPIPIEAWFDQISKFTYESEPEVVAYFLSPLFDALGYTHEDYFLEYPVMIPSKFRSTKVKNAKPSRIDMAVFNGADRSDDNLLVVIEAKKPHPERPEKKEEILSDAFKEIQIYISDLNPRCLTIATDGDDLDIFDHESKKRFHRSELKDQWQALYFCLGKAFVLAEKQRKQ